MAAVTSALPEQPPQQEHLTSSTVEGGEQLNTNADCRSSEPLDDAPALDDVTSSLRGNESGVWSGAGVTRLAAKAPIGEKRRKSTWLNVS